MFPDHLYPALQRVLGNSISTYPDISDQPFTDVSNNVTYKDVNVSMHAVCCSIPSHPIPASVHR